MTFFLHLLLRGDIHRYERPEGPSELDSQLFVLALLMVLCIFMTVIGVVIYADPRLIPLTLAILFAFYWVKRGARHFY